MRSASDSRLRELQPLCRQIAVKLVRQRSLPASVTLDELVQAGMVGADDRRSRWTAAQAGLAALA